jgi:hypothetical protein
MDYFRSGQIGLRPCSIAQMRQDQRRALAWHLITALLALFDAACSTTVQLAKPLNLYLDGQNYPATLVSPALQVVSSRKLHLLVRRVAGWILSDV